MSSIEISEHKGVRYLHFGSEWVQGAMRIRQPDALELAYTRDMMAGLLLRDDSNWPQRVLLIGLGAASLTKFCYRFLPQTQIQVVEIDPQVVATATHYFKLPPCGPRLQIHVDDGAHWIQHSEQTFNAILVDGFDHQARAGALDTLAFYQSLLPRLAPDGLVTVNLFGRSRGFQNSLARLNEAFSGRVLAFPSCDSGNVVALAAVGDRVEQRFEALRQRAEQLKTQTGLDLSTTVSRIEREYGAQLFSL